MIIPHQHQNDAASEIDRRWLKPDVKNVLCVLPTGAGKTILKAMVAQKELANGGCVVIFAHRDVLLEQISIALCLFGIKHNFYTSQSTKRMITDAQVRKFGVSYYSESAKCFICSVDTFWRRDLKYLAPNVTLWMLDEAHHLLDNSKWHRCIDPLVNARGLGVTATPIRADKKGLGRGQIVDYELNEETGEFDYSKPIYDNHGLFDDLISDRDINATMHDLITLGRLSMYRVFSPPQLVDISEVKITTSGDYNQKQLAKVTDRAEITGDVVKHYRNIAPGLQTIVFAVDIAHSIHVAEAFKKAGFKAIAVSSQTKDSERARIIDEFRKGNIQILVNCDLFGEGFDVPAVACVIMLRKTESYSLFKQQFGRALRVLEGKEFGIIIDHVGNVESMMYQYGLQYPHDDPEWSLLPRKRKNKTVTQYRINSRVCPKCFARYVPEKGKPTTCTVCHHTESAVETIDAEKKYQVKEGNLVELEVAVLQKIKQERAKIDIPMAVMAGRMSNQPENIRDAVLSKHARRQHAQTLLRDAIQKWCMQIYNRVNDMEYVRNEFTIKFGVDPRKAATLNESQANELRSRIIKNV